MSGAVAQILANIENGDPKAASQLFPLVYDELRKLAAQRLAFENPGQTLQATALVHEVYLRLVGREDPEPWNGRVHFFAAAAESMRRILVDHARRKAAIKRGGKVVRVDLDPEQVDAIRAHPEGVVAIHDALDALAAEDSLAADLVKLHYFGGFAIEEAAKILGMSRAAGYRQWTYARAWLRATLEDKMGPRCGWAD